LHAAAGVRRKCDFSEVVLRWGRGLLARRNADADEWHFCAGADRRGVAGVMRATATVVLEIAASAGIINLRPVIV
jgi:hypothetical protein